MHRHSIASMTIVFVVAAIGLFAPAPGSKPAMRKTEIKW